MIPGIYPGSLSENHLVPGYTNHKVRFHPGKLNQPFQMVLQMIYQCRPGLC